METKHTQGKWKVGTIGKQSIMKEVQFGDNYRIAFCEDKKGLISIQEAEANAKLIASAPEMLEQLQIMVKHFERAELIENVYGEYDRNIIESAKQLIKKATE